MGFCVDQRFKQNCTSCMRQRWLHPGVAHAWHLRLIMRMARRASFRSFAATTFADWWVHQDDCAEPSNAMVAWAGVNNATLVYDTFLRIYHAVWVDPRPDTEVTSMTLFAAGRISALHPRHNG